ncbi:MAG: hypothetical protein JSV09_05815 [Thermoplasmata archaeon]|nr:MAG: hypothetical protein JSV09_05815 [Thermoplasmata archaeon]
MRKIQTGSSKIYIPDIIIGLVSESSKVKKAYNKIKPGIVAIQTSEEELEGLRGVVEGQDYEYFLSNYEEVYARKLAIFGEVKVPPPCYETALKLCIENEIPISAIDMDDMYFADVFIENISGWDLIRHSVRIKRLRRKRFKAESPEDFVREWDREINKLKGFRNLESKREEHMARELLRLGKDHDRILCIMEMQRAEGVCDKVLKGKKS